MKALVMKKYGGPEVMELRDVPQPGIGPKEALVEIRAAALNPVDYKIRDGLLKMVLKFEFPQIMGNEMSGIVTEVGPEVTELKVGDAVYGRVSTDRMGAFAEYIAVDESEVALKPKNLSFVESAAVPLAGLTAWQCLFDRMKLTAGQKVLVHAGAGGVGTFAIQFAKHAGLHVAATASARNHDLLRELGADDLIDYTKEDFTERIKDFDGVLESIGGQVQLDSFNVVKPGGWVVSIASMPDPQTAKEMGMNPLLCFGLRFLTRKERGAAKRAGVHYRFLFLELNKPQLEEITALLEAGSVKPIIDSTYPLEEFDKAFAHLEKGHARGKITLDVKDGTS